MLKRSLSIMLIPLAVLAVAPFASSSEEVVEIDNNPGKIEAAIILDKEKEAQEKKQATPDTGEVEAGSVEVILHTPEETSAWYCEYSVLRGLFCKEEVQEEVSEDTPESTTMLHSEEVSKEVETLEAEVKN